MTTTPTARGFLSRLRKRPILAGVIVGLVFFVVLGVLVIALAAYPWRKDLDVVGAMLLSPQRLVLFVPTCEMQPEVTLLEETEVNVQVKVTASVSPFQSSGLDCQDPVEVQLQQPLGDRVVVDRHTERTVQVEVFRPPVTD